MEGSGARVGFATGLLIVLASALVLVWPLAHVIAVRNTLLLGIFLWLAIDLVRKPELRSVPQGAGAILVVLALMGLWLLTVALFVDEDPRRSLDPHCGVGAYEAVGPLRDPFNRHDLQTW